MNERKELGKILFLTRESRIDIFNSSSHRVIFFYYVDKLLAQNKLDFWRNGVINIFTRDDIKYTIQVPDIVIT